MKTLAVIVLFLTITCTLTSNFCYWDGTAPFCHAECPSGYVACKADNCGDGKCCLTGTKLCCCNNPDLCVGNSNNVTTCTMNSSIALPQLLAHYYKLSFVRVFNCQKSHYSFHLQKMKLLPAIILFFATTCTLAREDCYWDGTAPWCDGKCPSTFTECKDDPCGDGECCQWGLKACCCSDPELCPERVKHKLSDLYTKKTTLHVLEF
uniref:Granulins domain-containing protein n=1 Tax=Strigamia maritima TaxID=126957 RepID=T1JMR0_STRMM